MSEKPYGISPGPGACCPDQPNCKHCEPENVKPKCETCGTKLVLCYEWDPGGLRGDVLKCPKCTPISKGADE